MTRGFEKKYKDIISSLKNLRKTKASDSLRENILNISKKEDSYTLKYRFSFVKIAFFIFSIILIGSGATMVASEKSDSNSFFSPIKKIIGNIQTSLNIQENLNKNFSNGEDDTPTASLTPNPFNNSQSEDNDEVETDQEKPDNETRDDEEIKEEIDDKKEAIENILEKNPSINAEEVLKEVLSATPTPNENSKNKDKDKDKSEDEKINLNIPDAAEIKLDENLPLNLNLQIEIPANVSLKLGL